MTASSKIFVSYRQADNRHFVLRIRDWLTQKYGRGNVFMDFDTLPPFVRFEDFIRKKIGESDVMMPIIGPDWLKLLNEKIVSGEKDYVRIELENALAQKRLIAPICILGAEMPNPRDLPEGLREMCEYNAARLDDDRTFYDEIERMMQGLDDAIAMMQTTQAVSEMLPPLPKNLKDDLSLEQLQIAHIILPEPSAGMTARQLSDSGLSKIEKGDVDGAIADYDAAIRLDPTMSAAWNNRAHAYIVQGKYEQAESNASQAIKLDIKNAYAYTNRAAARYHLKRNKEAILDADQAIKLDKAFARPHLWRGMAYADESKLAVGNVFYSNVCRRQAIESLTKYLEMGGGTTYGDGHEVEVILRELGE